MQQQAREATLEELMGHAGWVRALARRLIREDAEDLVQDVWVQATRHPPRTAASPRAWLARVLRNRAHNQARDGHRRRRREDAAGALVDSPPTPQELTERMEMHRLLAELVGELPDEYRQVIHLRYVEEREPADIARLLQQPPGTIRWRLHEALARLRTRLDERAGGRRAWILALAPLAGWPPEVAEASATTGAPRDRASDARTPGAPAPAPALTTATIAAASRPARGLSLFSLALTALGLVACSIVALVWHLDNRGAATRRETIAGLAAGGDRGAVPPGPRTPRLTAQAAAIGADPTCPEIEPMRRYAAAFKAAADPWRNPRDVFAEGAPNPALETALRPMMDGFLEKMPPGCDLSLSCRGLACELAVLSADGVRSWDCFPKIGPEFYDRLAPGMNNLVDSGTPYHDPIKGKSFTRMSQMWRFHREDGAPVARLPETAEPELKFDLSRPAPAPPAELSKACRERWDRLERDCRELLRNIVDLEPRAVFATSAPDPDLTGRVTTWARRALERPSGPLPLSIECRGDVCQLAPVPGEDPLAIKWECREASASQPASCLPESGSGDWYDLLSRGPVEKIGRIRRPLLRAPAKDVVRPAYLVVMARNRLPSPWRTTLAFADSFDWRAAVRSCEAQLPERGKIEFRLDVPETAGDESPPNRIVLHMGGALGGTPLARCISSAFETASARFTVPVTPGSVMYGEFNFPFDVSALEKKLQALRERVKAEHQTEL